MSPTGRYRTSTAAGGAESAFVDYGIPDMLGEMPRARYEAERYKPAFDSLPTKEEYEAANGRS